VRKEIHFWAATLIRGAVALIVGSAVMIVPDMATTLLLLPFAITISIVCLASYAVLDSAVVFITSFMVSSRHARLALRLQGTLGVTLGVVLLSIAFERVHLQWFLYLIGLQALCTAIAEFVVARHAVTRSTSVWNYAAALVALLFVVGYSIISAMAEEALESREIAWLIYGYLIAFGMAQCITAARMLYADRHTAATDSTPN
jgi:uncharacterized membrane protein HdeD (DUF308 family)